MKTKGAEKVHYESGPNMIPLVDVVMVILIFLMLAGTFGGATQFILSKQGLHGKDGRPAPHDPNKPMDTPVEIDVDNIPDPSSPDGGGFRAQGTGITPTASGEMLRRQLAVKLEQFKAAGTSPDQLEIVLYPGRNVKYRNLIEVYQAALQAKYTKVAFATSH
ncbi:MAG TPA: biopolymer transporter ExbD [Humisphaera sp.]|nr:biopolymer transporter ExbD [Humisphaera sp.]